MGMHPRFWRYILGKLIITYGLVVIVAVVVLAVVVRVLMARHVSSLVHTVPDTASSAMTEAHFLSLLNQSLIWAGLAALGVAVLFSLVLARFIVRPLRDLSRAIRKIAAGDYRQRVELKSDDEIGELAQAFNDMAASLQQMEELRRDLVANVAHELRTPLTSIEGYLEAIEDGVYAADGDAVARIRSEAARLHRLVDDLTELSRLEAGQERLQKQPCRLADVVEAVIARLRSLFEEKGVALRVNVPRNLPRLTADAARMEQVLNNLLTNALRYTPSGGQVEIAASRQGDAVKLAVSDTGAGIPEKDLPHIFERFYRGDNSRSRATGGTGIGLTIVKHIVEGHGGTIAVASEVGAGSRFEITLPLTARILTKT